VAKFIRPELCQLADRTPTSLYRRHSLAAIFDPGVFMQCHMSVIGIRDVTIADLTFQKL
jgi:hypothetical protein